MTNPSQNRFLGKVDKNSSDECWNWMGFVDEDGYGRFWLWGTMTGAHRASWDLFVGPVPDGMCVCHKCDNPACVNPSHLFVGTNQDNINDKISKGRHKGINLDLKNNMAKISHEDKGDIFEMNNRGYTQTEIAKVYGVSQPTIWRAIKSIEQGRPVY